MRYPLENWGEIKRGYKFGQKTFYTEHHLGVDYIVPVGTIVYAPADCEIIVSGNFTEGGNTLHVRIDDQECGRLIMRFMHLRELSAKGVYKKGDVLGYTGNTGKYTTGPHLHLDISEKVVKIKEFNNFIDPDEFFAQRNNDVELNNMVTYQKEGDSKIYALVGNILIPFDAAYETYQEEFSNAELKILPIAEFNKFKVSKTVKIVPK